MTQRHRLVFLVIALALLVVVGWSVTGGLTFVVTDFWFSSGLLLVLLLSLVDQPHYSRDANVFANGITGWVSLLLVPIATRSAIWWIFLGWTVYLTVASLALMWIRRSELSAEPQVVQLVSRINRHIGRPEALFSALFLWGAILQFGQSSGQLGALFVYWAVFMILNLPAVAGAIDSALAATHAREALAIGRLRSVRSPNVVVAELRSNSSADTIGTMVQLRSSEGTLASGISIDDRIVAGHRLATIALVSTTDLWPTIADLSAGRVSVYAADEPNVGSAPVSVTGTGSEIGKLVFEVHPRTSLEAGEVLWTPQPFNERRAYFQVISGRVVDSALSDGNIVQSVRVGASELGIWDEDLSRFDPVNWLPPAGELVRRVAVGMDDVPPVPPGRCVVGHVPNSAFPAHVSLPDLVTHNTAIIGVTGSGKSFLAFHLVDALAQRGIKVLILDISRQHDSYLSEWNPTPLSKATEIEAWLTSESTIGIHQFAVDGPGYPQVTADFTSAAYSVMSREKLRRGMNIPARLCIVLEEAHSLIPEWTQVAVDSDKHQVNKTARTILQGRKYGMGTLIVTQRTANVTKTILNQCNTIFALQSFDQTGLDFLRNYMGEDYSSAISTLPHRHAILVGMASSSTRPLLFKIPDWTERWTALTPAPAQDPSGMSQDEEQPNAASRPVARAEADSPDSGPEPV